MRWVMFMIFVIFVITLQAAVAPRIALFGQRPDALLVIVVFFALYARPYDAVLGAWIVGICSDLLTIERFGFLALSYALAALLVVSVREYLFRYHPITQFAMTAVAAILMQFAWLIYRRILYQPIEFFPVEFITSVIWVSLYTACFAPPVHKVLLKMSRLFGIAQPRYSFAGLSRMRAGRV